MALPTPRSIRDNAAKNRRIHADPSIAHETKARYGEVYAARKASRFHHDNKGRSVDIDPEMDVRAVGHLCRENCAYCGVVFAGGVDRTSNTGGYFLPNLKPCCGDCNAAKGGLHGDHFVAHAHRVVDYQDRVYPASLKVRARHSGSMTLRFFGEMPPPPRCAWTSMMRGRAYRYAFAPRKQAAFARWKRKSLVRRRKNKPPEIFYCTLTQADWERLVSGPCVFCGEAPAHGIDRIHDADRGYSPEGSQSCCLTCNFAKGAASNAEFVDRLRRIAELNPYNPETHEHFVGVTAPTPDNYYHVSARERVFKAVSQESPEFIEEKRRAEGIGLTASEPI